MQDFCEFFDIRPGITALIGGGGKTSTMYALADHLKTRGSVIVSTSTHILRPPQYPFLPRLIQPLPFGDVVSVGTLEEQKLSAPEQEFAELTRFTDYVLVEADGSKQLPLKAHAKHEPVIPLGTNTVLAVIGIDGLGQPICSAAHRPALYAGVTRSTVDDIVTEQMIAEVVSTYPRVDGIVINKADDPERAAAALSLASLFHVPVAVTAWQSEQPIKAYRRNRV